MTMQGDGCSVLWDFSIRSTVGIRNNLKVCVMIWRRVYVVVLLEEHVLKIHTMGHLLYVYLM